MSSRKVTVEGLEQIYEDIVDCQRCSRLVQWREQVAVEKKAAHRREEYWGRPVPGFGDPAARIVVVGLAPAAHGANRTGRMFTGDRSGDWLYRSLYRAGLANQPTSRSVDDGLVLSDCWITAAVKCAPPANKPIVAERDVCVETFLANELGALEHKEVVVCLGKFSFDVVTSLLAPKPRPRFTHGVEVIGCNGSTILGSFHPSQQNTFTGKLTETAFDAIFERAAEVVYQEKVKCR